MSQSRRDWDTGHGRAVLAMRGRPIVFWPRTSSASAVYYSSQISGNDETLACAGAVFIFVEELNRSATVLRNHTSPPEESNG